ncbi:SUVH2 [Acorus gramineus]|uniref:SUVH2 n=1 Tax=Acorus gramineus TaxID=55184 RepID=A0AAV9ANX0_ACOGR|nr:SUVH2 [Acorus gramineus]
MGSYRAPILDLNLLPDPPFLLTPKIEPKIEPDEPAISPPFFPPPNPNPNPSLDVSDPDSTIPDEASIYSDFLRVSQLFFRLRPDLAPSVADPPPLPLPPPTTPSSSSAALAVPPPPATPSPSASALVDPSAKPRKTPRSAEMVRVASMTPRDGLYFRAVTRRTRATYEALRLLLMRLDEREDTTLWGFGRRNRADLKAAAIMGDRGMWLNRDRRIIGPIPGVHVGDLFFFRMELCVIGLHGMVQAGIDYVPATRTRGGQPIATSIIVSGGYEDDEDGGDVLVYTGHGGKEKNNHRPAFDQKLEGGNLALERSMYYGIEVRVIRGFKYERSPSGRVYVYDGLYRIHDFWLAVGKSGFNVFKYKLVRIPNQPEMGSSILRFAEAMKLDPVKARPLGGFMSFDISDRKENFPVLLFNDIDDDRTPMLFEYTVRPVYPPIMVQQYGGGCDCVGGCTEKQCGCAERNGGEFAYDSSGILIRGRPLVVECGRFCRCPLSCPNRVSQKGVRHRLEVFRSRETGWGVRSLDVIRAGEFLCEFTGVILTRQQAEIVAMNGDSLVYPDRFPQRWVELGDVSQVLPDFGWQSSALVTVPSAPDFSIDVSTMRNVACYFSHSSNPNIMVQFVLFDHYDSSYPHVMLFALENVLPLTELSLDYGNGDGGDGWTVKSEVISEGE